MNMGFLDLNNPKKSEQKKYKMFHAYYLLGHPSVAGTNFYVNIILWDDKMTVYTAFQKGFIGHYPVKAEEKYKLFDLPYEKIGSIGGNGSHLIVTAIGHDKSGGKRYIPIEFTIHERINGEPNKYICNQIKSALDKEINTRNEITI